MLLSLAYGIALGTETDLNAISDSRDMSAATGATLDNYGAMVGVSRNGATDEQYQTKILNQISRNVSGVDANSIIKAIALTLKAEETSISISEGIMSVTVNGLTVAMLDESGYSASEISEMISGLLPIGVSLGSTMYAGTLLLVREYTVAETGVYAQYPHLWNCWWLGQAYSLLYGQNVGLSGEGTVPATFNTNGDIEPYIYSNGTHNSGTKGMQTSGTYDGGTLSILI